MDASGDQRSTTMSNVPHAPEDNLSPPSFATMNEFCRTLAVGGT
jgi:hypothetical protein